MSSILLKQQVRKKPAVSSLLKKKRFLFILLPLLFAFAIPDVEVWIGANSSAFAYNLPREADLEAILSEYLITEPINSEVGLNLNPEVVQNLKFSTYAVRNGDTLSGVANRFGLNIDTIISINDIKDAQALVVGMKLEIPNKNGLRYRVKRGDSLGKIANIFAIPLETLVDWNNLDSAVIKPGQELFVVGARLSTNSLNRVLGKLFIYPTKGRLTSRFGSRKNPFSGVAETHKGIDLGNFVGTPIAAAMNGTVARVAYDPWLGKYIILTHADGFQTLYGHLSKIIVSKGQRVRQGHKIGEMGNTGYSTGPHLHFVIFKNSVPVDPLKYLN